MEIVERICSRTSNTDKMLRGDRVVQFMKLICDLFMLLLFNDTLSIEYVGSCTDISVRAR